MHYENKKVKDPIQATFNDLKLFEQNSYCYQYIKLKNSDQSEETIKVHSEIASAAFRQANEYYKSAEKATITTSPLLYSYAMNNLLKGVCYLTTFDEKILEGFNAHGFKVERKYLKDDILKSKVTIMKRFGAVQAILKLYNNSLQTQDICLYKVLRHIPNIEKYYYESTGNISLIARRDKDDYDEFVFNGSNVDEEISEIAKELSIWIYTIPEHEKCNGFISAKTQDLFDEKVILEEDVYYKDYLNIPDKYEEGIKSLNMSFYCYILIMTYGMMVRYDANKWETYTDKKNSNYSTLIELSIPNAVMNFYYQMHNLIFGFYYEDDSYTNMDIKRIIKEETPAIMNNITRKIKDESFRFNRNVYLPWEENVR